MLHADPYARAATAMVKARINAIYYERYTRFLERWDIALRLLAALLASGGVYAAVTALNSKLAIIMMGLVSAFVSVSGVVLRLPDRARATAKMLPLYVAVHGTLTRLASQGDDVDAADVDLQLEELQRLAVLEAQDVRTRIECIFKKAEVQAYEENGLPLDGLVPKEPNANFGNHLK